MISNGIILVIVAGLIVGGSATYFILENNSNTSVEFPLSLNDPLDDLIYVTAQTWNSRGRPNGTMASESEYSQYYDHVDFLNVALNQTPGGFDISMQWAGDVVISEGVVYAICIELINISYIITYTEGNLICALDTPKRNLDWYDYYYTENSTLISEFSVSGPYINLTLDIEVDPRELSYILAISGIGEYEYYMDFLELEVRPEEEDEGEMPSVFNEIYIRGDTDFTEDNGVSRGTGTQSDPYVIEDITVNGAFKIVDTSKYVEIRDVIITGNSYMGIYGDNIKVIDLIIDTSPDNSQDPYQQYNIGLAIIAGSNIKVYGVDILTRNLSNGIKIGWAKDIYISGAKVNGAQTGINMFGPENVTVEYCTVENCSSAAFNIQNSKNVKINNCTVTNNSGNAIFSASTADTVYIEHCDFIDNNQGLWLGGPNFSVTYCNIIRNYCGLRLERECANLIIRYNNLESQSNLYWQTIEQLKPEVDISNNYWDPYVGSIGDTNPLPNRIPNAGVM